MRRYVAPNAARDLLSMIGDSYFGGLCSWSETASRLHALVALVGGGREVQIAQRALILSNFPIDDPWIDDGLEGQGAQDSGKEDSNRSSTTRIVLPSWLDEDEPPIVRLIAAASTGLSDWEFHQSDPDFFPSIPHGHWRGADQPKFDPYTGFVYQGSRQIRRERRMNVVALWNDAKFREFARRAIDYYLTTFPAYSGWRVKNPRRLPRRR